MTDDNKSREELLKELEALRMENRQLRKAAKQKPGLTILVVDDNEATREIVAEMIAELGFSPLEAGTPSEALTLFKEKPGAIDLVITDIVMPGGDGPDLMRDIAKINNTTKVIFMSGYSGDEIVHDSVYQVQDSKASFIKKPFTLAELNAIIQEQMNHKGSAG